MNLKPAIKEPCLEDWDKMKIGVCSRHCEVCHIDVMDFTSMSRIDILSYIYENKDKKICGRFRESQLDFTYEEIVVSVKRLLPKTTQKNHYYWLLSLGTLALLSCSSTLGSHVQNTVFVQKPNDRISLCFDTLNLDTNWMNRTYPSPEIIGDVIPLQDPPDKDENGIYAQGDKMPEFKGSKDSLMAYIKEHLVYPQWEYDNKILGRVIVRFVVDETGTIKDPKIMKRVEGSRNFDTEVLRLIQNMPAWEAGEVNGEKVPIYFYLPVDFILE